MKYEISYKFTVIQGIRLLALTVGVLSLLSITAIVARDVHASGGSVFSNPRAIVNAFAADPTNAVKVIEANCDQSTVDAIEAALTPQPAADEKLRKLEQARSDILAAGITKNDSTVTELDKDIAAAQQEVDDAKEAAEEAAAEAQPVSP